MNGFVKHNQLMRSLFESANLESLRSAVGLDEIDSVLRNLLTVKEMKDAGSYFTGQRLATEAVNSLEKPILSNSKILDPNCGAGNLLIECSRLLDIRETLSETLIIWGESLWGFDIHQHFIDAAKIRLAIEAVNRGAVIDCSLEDSFNLLPNIKLKDALEVESFEINEITHAIMNPPFSTWPSPETNYWKKGKVNSAGIFLDRYLRILPSDCCLSAILPDVLRSGSRYGNFRDFVNRNISAQCQILGKFSKTTKVDVFLLFGVLHKDQKGVIKWQKDLGNYSSISDKYDVTTGPLVAYRDKEEGPLYPYFHPKNCPAWETINTPTEMRRFQGTLVYPPVVLVKRTSSPSDRFRASATVIEMKGPIAVENHMIIIKPKSSRIDDCHELLKILMSARTNEFLNERSRMRHLTVGAVKSIPLT